MLTIKMIKILLLFNFSQQLELWLIVAFRNSVYLIL